MKYKSMITLLLLVLFASVLYAENGKTDANIFGHVVCSTSSKHIPFATIMIKGTSLGTTTDQTGHYSFIHLPEGTHVLRASNLGHSTAEKEITIKKGETKEVNFRLEEDALGLEEIIITGNRMRTSRRESSTLVHTITPAQLSTTGSNTLSEGLRFSPGLRIENNCQNCGFTQVRMNGLEGPYTQILINSRPVFSGLAGVYGLELIPANMIERVEVIRGGGSALYGGNAIAGTINVILREPKNNSYEAGFNHEILGFGTGGRGNLAHSSTVNFNTALVSPDNKSGIALYGYFNDRDPFDANEDDFSELPALGNTTVGSHIYHRIGQRGKITADLFNIKEERRGGDRFSYPVHTANIAEAVNHNITTGSLSFEQYFRKADLLSVYAAAQRINRDSYYGAEQSLSDYGNTKDLSFTIGTQYNINSGASSLVTGVENTGTWLKDKKLGYLDLEGAVIDNDAIEDIPFAENVVVADQNTNTIGLFSQYERRFKNMNLSVGLRLDHYTITDAENSDADNSGTVLSPRAAFRYDILESLQARISYSEGYRAPQIFDEDLHIETSGSRQVIHENDPGLKQETSRSFMASLDFNRRIRAVNFGFLLEGFYTLLYDPFANEFSDPDDAGRVIHTRINAEEGASVRGINMEMNVIPSSSISIKSGFTFQNSEYEEAQEFDEKRFFRTPRDYGYFILDWQATQTIGFSSTGYYTGKMLVPYFGTSLADPDEGELRESQRFFDLALSARYNIKLNGMTMQLSGGVQNILNSYQSDFDSGVDRDPGYMYGPMKPRALFFGLKLGNFL